MTSNPVYRFFATAKNSGPFLLRMLLAAVFFCHTGKSFFGWFPAIEIFVNWNNLFSPGLAHSLILSFSIAETALALLLFFGFLTRLAALGSVLLIACTIALIHWNGISSEIQYPFTLGIIALALVFLGSGRFSIDGFISRQLLPTVG